MQGCNFMGRVFAFIVTALDSAVRRSIVVLTFWQN